jgi:hypothetical protein
MDVERFISCLIKTANQYAEKAQNYFEINKSDVEKMDFLPENLCPYGKRCHIHNFYSIAIKFYYNDFFINALSKKPSGFSIMMSFEIYGFQHDIYISSLDNAEKVKEKISHYFYIRAMNINRYLEELEKIREFLKVKIN